MMTNSRILKWKKKKQHTIPECYLKNFADSDYKIWVLNLDRRQIYPTNPKDVLTGNHFYTIKFPAGGGSIIVEDTLGTVESKYAEIFQNKIRTKNPLTEQEKAVCSIFVAALLMRTKAMRDSIEDFKKRQTELINYFISMPLEQRKRMSRINHIGDKIGVSVSRIAESNQDIPSLHSSIMLMSLPEISNIIFKMKWCFGYPENTNDAFITSDNPCSLVNPTLLKDHRRIVPMSNSGLAQEDVELTLPLSSSLCLIATWKTEFQEYVSLASDLVEAINFRTILYVKDTILSESEERLSQILHNLRL